MKFKRPAIPVPFRRVIEGALGAFSRSWIRLFGTRNVIVLAYHSVHACDWVHAVVPDVFREQMRWLKEHTDVIRLEDVERIAEQGGSRCRKLRVAITFDDGYRDWVEEAMPILKEFQFPATFFVVSSFQNVITRRPLPDVEPMSPENVRRLADAGFEIGSHSHTHPDLSACPPEMLRHELAESRRILRELSGQDVVRMSYPKGRYAPANFSFVREAGYQFALAGHGAVHYGTEPLAAPRVPVTQPIDLARFKVRLYRAAAFGRV